MEASDNDIEVLSDTISSIKILSENENTQKDNIYSNRKTRKDDFAVNSMLITLKFFVLYEKFKQRDIQEKTRNLTKPRKPR